MASYFINLSSNVNGDGTTRATPYNSFASLPVLAAGDIVEVEPGSSQTMSAAYSVSASGSAASPITIRSNPAVTGPKPRLRIVSEGQVGFAVTSKSNIIIQNLIIEGDSSWTSSNTIGLRINGAGSNTTLTGVETRYCGLGFDLVGGFAQSNITLDQCKASYCRADGLRFWSGTGTYTWDNITISNGEFFNNGLSTGSNGAGISIQVQNSHTGTIFSNLKILRNKVYSNYRTGIALADNSVAFATIIDAANTTPPTRQIRNIKVNSNEVRFNGGAGIAVNGVQFGEINRNVTSDNSTRTTLGNIWTATSASLIVAFNFCERAYSNGTSTGDGCGIFDDQWNDGCSFIGNTIKNNVYVSSNPDYTSFGIGIYRTSNSKHYSNLIVGCRYGFIIGYVPLATAPVMANIVVAHNTILNCTKKAFSFWADLPASCCTIQNNVIDGCTNPMEALGTDPGNQTFTTNKAYNYTTASNGANIVDGCTFETGSSGVDIEGRITTSSAVYNQGTLITNPYIPDFFGKQIKSTPSLGARQIYTARTQGSTRIQGTRTQPSTIRYLTQRA